MIKILTTLILLTSSTCYANQYSYNVKKGLMPAGKARLTVDQQSDNVRYELKSQVTNPVFRKIFDFEFTITSDSHPKKLYSKSFKRIERVFKKYYYVDSNYNWQQREIQARRIVKKDNRVIEQINNTVKLSNTTVDVLSLLNFIRSIQLTPGKLIKVMISDGIGDPKNPSKNPIQGKFLVEAVEQIKISGKKYQAYKIVSKMEEPIRLIDGVEEKSFKVWISKDQNLIPLKIIVDLKGVGELTIKMDDNNDNY